MLRTFPFVIAGLLVTSVVAADASKSLAPATSTTSAKYILDLAGAHVDIDEATVVSDKLGEQDPQIHKPPPGKRDEIAMRGGATLARDLSRFYEEGFTKECTRRIDGSFIFADREYAELSRLTFSWGILTEVGFPALDSMVKGTASMTVKLQPEFPRRILQHGAPLSRPSSGPAWVSSAFKLSIDGFDGALKSVRQVSELHVSQAPTTAAPVQCAPPVVSDLSFTIPLADAPGFAVWKEGTARAGTLDYLAVDGSSVIKLKLNGLKKKAQVTEGSVARVTVSIESVVFDAKTSSSPRTK